MNLRYGQQKQTLPRYCNETNDRAMIIATCLVKPSDGVPFETRLSQLNIKDVTDIVPSGRLGRLDRVERS